MFLPKCDNACPWNAHYVRQTGLSTNLPGITIATKTGRPWCASPDQQSAHTQRSGVVDQRYVMVLLYGLFLTHLACSMVSLRYLHKKYELQPGMELPGLRVFFWTASAIFMKNWAICIDKYRCKVHLCCGLQSNLQDQSFDVVLRTRNKFCLLGLRPVSGRWDARNVGGWTRRLSLRTHLQFLRSRP